MKKAEHRRIDAFELWLEKTLESPLECKEIQPVHSKGNQSWIFIGRTDVEAETPILWPPDANNWLIWKDPNAGKDWGQEEKGTIEDEMVGWHHWLDGHEFEQAPGVGGWTGKPGVLQSMGLQRVGHDWETELNWTDIYKIYTHIHMYTNTPKMMKACQKDTEPTEDSQLPMLGLFEQ